MPAKKKKVEEIQTLIKPKATLAMPLSVPLAEMFATEGDTQTRRNKAGIIERTNRFSNIWNGITPFTQVKETGNVTVRDAVILCQNAYYNFGIFKKTIDLMVEFSTSPIKLKGGNKKNRDFFQSLLKRIGIWRLMNEFFMEYYRSGTVITYRHDVRLLAADITRLTQTFGLEMVEAAEGVYLPSKYIVLNPAEIEAGGNITFTSPVYYLHLTGYELQRLRKPVTDEDREVRNSLTPEVRNQIDRGGSHVIVPLDPANTVAVFYKKQSYEPLAVPMGYAVLSDLNWKEEMRKMDMAVTRHIQQAILLITMGAPPEEGGTNVQAMAKMQELFQNESVGRVLIADYTTKAQYIMPDIADFLDPKKYEAVDRDIRIGLNNVLLGEGEKFANQGMKVQVLIESLKQGREAFLEDFLIPEIKRISKEMGFKNFPTPYFEDINLKDSLEYAKVYTRLVEIGILTAEEGITAIETGLLPTKEESIESQTEFKALKDKGYYQPIVGGPQDQLNLAKVKAVAPPAGKVSSPTGRPKGTKKKQSTKKVKPMGANDEYSVLKVKDSFLLAQKVDKEVRSQLLKRFKIKELSKAQKEVAEDIVEVIISNEEPDNWLAKVKDYIENPVDTNPDRIKEVEDIALEHQLDTYLASILLASKV